MWAPSCLVSAPMPVNHPCAVLPQSAGGALFSSGGGLGSIVLSGATVANNSVTGASPRGGALSVHNVPELNATDSSLSGNTVTPFVSTGGSSLQTLIINTVGAGSGGESTQT